MKLNIIGKILSIMMLMSAFSAYSLDLPKQMIGNVEFYCYKVKEKESIYGISKKLNITKDELMKYNPSLADGLKKGYVLLIPVNLLDSKVKSSNVTGGESVAHVVLKGETLYGLSKTYNVSQEDIIALNPDIRSGLKSGQKILIPQPKKDNTSSTPTENNNNSDIIYHTIKKGETLYSLSKKYDTSIEKILSLNPGISPTNFKIDEIIKIIPNSAKVELTETTIVTMVPYVAKQGDDYKKIAKKNDVDIDDLKAANPNTDKVKKGKTIQIPITRKDSVLIPIKEGSDIELSNNNSERIQEIYDSIHSINTNGEVNIALLLPYMLNDNEMTKQSKLYTEFYKGFLIAVEEVKSRCKGNVNIYSFDTKGSLEELNTILSKPELKNMNLIFAPDELDQLTEISKFCKENKIYMVNAFSLKNEDYNSNPYMFQINIPQTFMYADVYDWFDSEFDDYEIVFVHKKGSAKKEFADELKKHIESKGRSVSQIEYNISLSSEQLSEQADSLKRYLYVPTTGTKSMMSKLVTAVKKLKSDRIDIDVSVLGQPEWITYMDEWSNDFHAVNTYFYSRFFVNPNNESVNRFDTEYKKWYGEEVINATPSFGYLGYDTGIFFMNALCKYDKDFAQIDNDYDGVQSHFNFERTTNWSGFINKSVYIVHFTPANDIEILIQ